MVGSNVNKKIFPFFNSVKEPVSSTGTSESFRLNCLYDSFNIEVSGMTSGEIVVEGCINVLNTDESYKTDEECVWTELSSVDLNSLSVVDKITSNGIYAIGSAGMNKIRVKINSISGSAIIVGVAGV